tara:strand:- start:1494 stop:1775 length:282 start_codon:yes stop_codon:yes gene_type:complete
MWTITVVLTCGTRIETLAIGNSVAHVVADAIKEMGELGVLMPNDNIKSLEIRQLGQEKERECDSNSTEGLQEGSVNQEEGEEGPQHSCKESTV